MAKQAGIITLDGTIDNISFFKTKDGYSARKKSGISASALANDPRFERTRENMAEFGRAAKAAKLLRDALLESTIGATDRRMVPRLTKTMMQVIAADAINTRGLRNVIDGEAELLQGFEFNREGTLTTVFMPVYAASIDRVTGSCKVTIPAYNAAKMIKPAEGGTHYRLGITAASIDFEAPTREVASMASAYFVLEDAPTAPLELEVLLEPNSTHPLFLAMTIEFVQEQNGKKYALKNGLFNACALVKVDSGV